LLVASDSPISISYLQKLFQKENITLKTATRTSHLRNETERLKWYYQPPICPIPTTRPYRGGVWGVPAERLIDIDEFALYLCDFERRRGRCPKGKRLVLTSKFSSKYKGKRLSVVMAVGCEGLVALMIVNGNLNHDLWKYFRQDNLIPRLCCNRVLMCDNLSAHFGCEEMVRSNGHLMLFRPAYSPDPR